MSVYQLPFGGWFNTDTGQSYSNSIDATQASIAQTKSQTIGNITFDLNYDKNGNLLGGIQQGFSPGEARYEVRSDGSVFRWSPSGGIVSDLGPIIATAALAYGLPVAGSALGAELGIGAAGGSALVGAGLGAAQGQDLGQIATNAAIGGAAGALGSTVSTGTESQVAGQLAGGTTSGLLRGQDLGTAVSNAALTTGANQAVGGLLNAATPTVDSTVPAAPSSAADYSTGADYSLAPTATSGLGLQATLAPLDMSNPYSFDTTASGLGFQASLAPFDPSNPYSLATNFGNQDSMGGGTGIKVPTQEGATLGSIGAETEESTGNPTNSATQNLLAKFLLSGLTGNKTGTSNMATNNNALLGGLLGNALTGASGLMQSNTNQAAYQTQADALRQAGQVAANQAQFRPVGTTTTFGTSNFTVDPTTGQLTSAGYSLSPQLQAYQNQIMGAGQQSLADAANLQNLGRGYIAQTPEQAAQQYMAKQQALLQPSRDMESARLANQLQQTGRTGVSVAQGGNLGMANPEQQALANARAMQDLQLAAQAQQAGQQQVSFGQGLLSGAYQPFQAGLNTAGTVEGLAQQPFTLSSDLAKQSAASGANAGRLGLTGNIAASDAMLKANQINPASTLLGNLGQSNLFGSALGNLVGSTSLGSSLGNWLGSLGSSANDYWTGSPTGLDTSNIDYSYLSNIYANNNPFAGVLGNNETWNGE